MIGHDETKLLFINHKLLLTNRQVANLHKAISKRHGRGINRAGEGIVRVAYRNKKGKRIVRAGHENKMDFHCCLILSLILKYNSIIKMNLNLMVFILEIIYPNSVPLK